MLRSDHSYYTPCVWTQGWTLSHRFFLFVFWFVWFSFFLFFFFFCFLRLHLHHTEVPRLGVKSELQLLAYTKATATATMDESGICDLHYNLQQCWILNLLSGARDQTHILVDASWVLNPLSHNGNSLHRSF